MKLGPVGVVTVEHELFGDGACADFESDTLSAAPLCADVKHVGASKWNGVGRAVATAVKHVGASKWNGVGRAFATEVDDEDDGLRFLPSRGIMVGFAAKLTLLI